MKLYLSKYTNTKDFLRQCIIDFLSLSNDTNIIIKKTNNGKPYVDSYDINFSVSHSGDYIVIVVSKNLVGIDLEKIVNREYNIIAKRFFKQDEFQLVIEKGIEEFYRLWTTKEALCKLLGSNLNTKIDIDYYAKKGYDIQHLNMIDDYYLTIISVVKEKLII